ncbi:HNH endonuclease [Tumebacillus flagellatus]|uniref:LXG domain-containing protein n=1 Tax=Tumebacillus flagellatus TaxID=1157490 RepID=A0A074LWM1_9BACL|nr:HNH endonuclease [Tumebacillus flagellatus]KEO84483.1 hypothetical protein EL26_05125 [Tumebacillus flagellatus]
MVEADPQQLRFLAQRFAGAANDIRRQSSRIETQAHALVQGASGWKGQAADSFVTKAEFLAGEYKKYITTFDEISSTLSTLAYKVETIQQKRQNLQRLENQRNHLHWSANPANDAEIAYLDGQIAWLAGEIETESWYADQAAATAFRGIDLMEGFQSLWDVVKRGYHVAEVYTEDVVIPALDAVWKDVEEHPEEYLKKFGNLLLDGVEEFLGIPEIVESWNTLTDSNSSWGDRLEAAGSLIFNVGTDVLMVVGVGEEIRGAELLAKAGAKFGPALQKLQQAREYGKQVLENGARFYREVKNGDREITLFRGMGPNYGLATAGGADVRAAQGFSFFNKADESVVRFSGNLNGQSIEKASKKVVPEGYDSVEQFLASVEEVKGYESKEEFARVVENTEKYLNEGTRNKSLVNGKYAGKEYKGVEFDCIGYPIFGPYSKFEAKIHPNDFLKNDDYHFANATKQVSVAIQNGSLDRSLFTDKQLSDIEKGLKKIEGYTWHHHQVEGKLQLVPTEIHFPTKHTGGRAIWGGGESCR